MIRKTCPDQQGSQISVRQASEQGMTFFFCVFLLMASLLF
ncbi:Uncharacterized protein dnm_049430 [Desulfonema magnum]|uniref:Uncharacterized protein n=1 Tax=Desulfonema magnum TaxID=45655 RepID=A0A975BNU0_9BACT|nr:Uncharacterized protein dnm_049430 [Desulfonema magnum]